MAEKKADVSVRYYKKDAQGNPTNESVYSASYQGPALIVRGNLERLANDMGETYIPEYTIRGEIPAPLNKWWSG